VVAARHPSDDARRRDPAHPPLAWLRKLAGIGYVTRGDSQLTQRVGCQEVPRAPSLPKVTQIGINSIKLTTDLRASQMSLVTAQPEDPAWGGRKLSCRAGNNIRAGGA
jgi:hypothetical protein